MVVEFSHGFLKKLKKHLPKQAALDLLLKLKDIVPTDGSFIARIGNVVLKEKKLSTFRFYFIYDNKQFLLLDEDELKRLIIRFIDVSKKNDQDRVITKLRADLKNNGFHV